MALIFVARRFLPAAFLLVSILLALGCGGCGKNRNAFRAMPDNAAIVLQINGLSNFESHAATPSDALWPSILQTAVFQKFKKDALTARSIFGQNAETAFAKNMLVAGANLNEPDSLYAVFALDIGGDIPLEKWLESSQVVRKKFPQNFKGHTIFTLQLAGNERFAAAKSGTLLLFSRLPYLVEEALTALENGDGAWSNAEFRALANPEAPGAHFFVNAAAVAEQWQPLMNPDFRHLAQIFRSNLAWWRLSFDGKNLQSKIAPAGLLGALEDWGDAPRNDIFAVLPDNTALLLWAGCGNKKTFFKKLASSESIDFQRFIEPWAGREAAFVLTEPFSPKLAEEQYLLFAAPDGKQTEAAFEDMETRFGLLKKWDYQTFKLRQFANGGMLAGLFESGNAVFRNPVFARVGNYAVVAHSPAAMEIWIDKHIVNETLANTEAFLLLQKKLPASGQGLVFLNGQFLPELVRYVFGEKKSADSDAPIFEKNGLFALDIAGEGLARAQTLTVEIETQGLVHQNASEATILWKTPLAAEAATRPFVIENAQPDGEAAIVVQDARHQLYRLTANGEVKWRRQLDAGLRSAVQGFDFLGNKTRCYLFNTPEKIWLLDDEGHDVEGFPLRLASPATNGATLVSFSQSGDYAFFVACANGNLYGFDRHGRPLPGWNPQPGVGQVAHPVLHFQHGNKDFLVALNLAGKLHVFGRLGERRFEAPQLEGKFLSPPQADAGKQSPRIVCTNNAGKAFVCNLSGEVFSLQLLKNEALAKSSRFVFASLAADARKDYAILNGQNLALSGYEGAGFKSFFNQKLPLAADTIFEVRGASGEARLGLLAGAKRQIFLFDGRGRLHPDFPLAGSTPFSTGAIFGAGKSAALLVGNGASVYAFEIK